MCGRFTRNYTWAPIQAMYSLTSVPSNVQPSFNVCPTDTVDAMVRSDDKRVLLPMRWGLIPGWWKKPLKEMRVATFNARSDSIAHKPMFRESFERRRCFMPASGYYEWVTAPDKSKHPFYFTLGGSIEIETQLATDLGNALADPTQLELAILNLAINARDAMSGVGRLTNRTGM